MGEFLRVAFAVAAKDLKVEHRSKTALISAIAFAALVLVIFNFARDAAAVSREALAPSVLWITFSFSGMIALNRSFALERENAALDGLLLAPVSRSALFLGKYLANLAFVFTVEAVALPLFVLFFGVDLSGALGGILVTAFLATIGFVAVGTVFAAMTVRTRFAELMLPLLVLPFLLPPVIGAVQVTARLLAGRPLSEIAGWLRILGFYDLVFVTLCLLLFPPLMDE
ncbi:MAG TPA: heme exporter protein CcmB [Gemmatimonadales bacterium]|jgi:heme exporter protein B|nr:heme exporter protein CcmB [Gemmatimonadales bacterium]